MESWEKAGNRSRTTVNLNHLPHLLPLPLRLLCGSVDEKKMEIAWIAKASFQIVGRKKVPVAYPRPQIAAFFERGQ